jgi:hypothetical protein
LYFEKDLVNYLKEYCDICRELAILNRNSQRKNVSDVQQDEIYKSQDQLFEREFYLYKQLKNQYQHI